MSTRRPRIKAVANIGAKRKIKEEIVDKPENDQTVKKIKDEINTSADVQFKIEETPQNFTVTTFEELPTVDDFDEISQNENFEDLGKSPTTDKNTVRPRQRLKVTPIFDARRTSLHNDPSENITIEAQLSHIKEPKLPPPPPPPNTYNRTPTRVRTESFSSPTYHQNYAVASISAHTSDHHSGSSPHYPPSREHIPPRHRKISTMEDAQRLTVARKEFNLKYSRKSPEKSVLKMFDFIYYNPSSNPMKFDEKCSASSKELAHSALVNTSRRQSEIDIDRKDHKISSNEVVDVGDPKTENESSNNLPVPQLKLGPNGEIILDEKSLLIETTAEKQARSNLAAPKKYIYLDEYSGNNGFYSRQKRTKDWSSDETIKFYRCLHTVGTDFSLMLTLFPNRSRRDLKLKFKKEEKFNGDLVNKAILYPKAFNIDELQREFDREEEVQLEKMKQWKLENEQKAKQLLLLKDDVDCEKFPNSKSGRLLTKGNLAYKHANLDIEKKPRSRKKDDLIKTQKKNINSSELNQKISNNLNEIKSPVYKCDEELTIDDSPVASGSVEITDIGEIFSFGDIIPQLKGSSLALVSSVEDNQNSDKATHELYIVCKETGVLSNQPLDLPKDTIECILMAMGKYEDV